MITKQILISELKYNIMIQALKLSSVAPPRQAKSSEALCAYDIYCGMAPLRPPEWPTPKARVTNVGLPLKQTGQSTS